MLALLCGSSSRRAALEVALMVAALSLAGCPTSMPPDGGDAGDGGEAAVSDVQADGRDVFQRDASLDRIFRPCASNTDCNLPGYAALFCDLDYPGGLCRMANCTRDSECGRDGICAGAGGCRPRCSPTERTCDGRNQLCFIIDPNDEGARGCFPSCSDVPAPMSPSCGSGQTCDLYRGVCTMRPSMLGAENGAPCRVNSDCRGGRCIPETETRLGMTMATGYVGGYCFSVAIQLPRSVFDAAIGGELPRSNCPSGSVVLPEDDEEPGDPTICWDACENDRDCREGYFCDHLRFTASDGGVFGPAYRTGACLPIDCASQPWASQANQGCPAGLVCHLITTMAGSVGRCGPPFGDAGIADAGALDAAPNDGGLDAAMD